MTNKFYTGIGSREVPNDIQYLMQKIATKLESLGFTLRSGGASGSDSAFESGVMNPRNKQIYEKLGQ
jgi:predicted Rossmann fold nucleotide-binding protein DprA/Smf involved in DNA uptake